MDRDARWSRKQCPAVLDGSLQRPQLLADRELDAENGRGMVLVNAMSSEWGMAATPGAVNPSGQPSTWRKRAPTSEGMGGSPDGTYPAERDSAG